MKSREERSRIIVEMPKSLHKRLKARAALEGTSMRVLIMQALEEADLCASSSHTPNKETRKVIKEAKQGKNLTEYKNLDEFFKKFGI